MRRALTLLWVVALSACAGGGMQSNSPILTTPSSVDRTAQTQAQTLVTATVTKTWIIGTGASYNYFSDQDLDFLPTAITIDAGDKIAYQVASGAGGDAHTVAFVPSGMTVPPPPD